ncbi:MAG: hypothetical protein ACLFVU_13205 [Phycisphaerae bacterium]
MATRLCGRSDAAVPAARAEAVRLRLPARSFCSIMVTAAFSSDVDGLLHWMPCGPVLTRGASSFSFRAVSAGEGSGASSGSGWASAG